MLRSRYPKDNFFIKYDRQTDRFLVTSAIMLTPYLFTCFESIREFPYIFHVIVVSPLLDTRIDFSCNVRLRVYGDTFRQFTI